MPSGVRVNTLAAKSHYNSRFKSVLSPIKSHLLEQNVCLVKHQDLQMFGSKSNKISNFPPLEVEGRGSDPQLQVGGNLDKIT